MSRTITALFDTRADADAGAERLRQAGVEASNVAVHDQSSHSVSGDYSTAKDKGMWESLKGAFLPRADRHAYEEGVRRGGFLLTADIDDDRTSAAVDALEDANSVDLDARTQEWRASGWDYADDGMDEADDTLVYGSRDTALGGSRYRSYLPTDPR